jgi:hypothetical protein
MCIQLYRGALVVLLLVQARVLAVLDQSALASRLHYTFECMFHPMHPMSHQ